MHFRSDGAQMDNRQVFKAKIKKPPKGYYNPPGGFTLAPSDNSTFSSYSPEG
jgi:hypothetical protein